MRFHLTHILTQFFLLIGLSTSAQVFEFNQFGPGSGFPSDGAYAIAEDDLGRLYVGSEGGGLVRFDGNDFEIWDHSTNMPADTVRCLFFDQNGALFIGTDHRGLWKMVGDDFTSVENDQLHEVQIRAIAEFGEDLYVATLEKGLFRLRENKLEHLNELKEENVRALLTDQDGSLWLGTDNGLFLWNQASPQLHSNELLHDRILTLYEDSEKRIWVGTQHGLVVLEAGNVLTSIPEALQNDRIRAIAQDDQGQYWIGTRSGAFEFDLESGDLKFYTSRNGLSNDRIRDIHRDRSGSLWFATYFGGICQLTGQSTAYYNNSQGLPETSISSMVTFGDSLLYFSTIDGDFYQWKKNNSPTTLTPSPGSAAAPIQIHRSMLDSAGMISLTADGRLLRHTHFKDILRFENEKLEANALSYASNRNTEGYVTAYYAQINTTQISTFDLACDELTDIAFTDSMVFIATSCGLFQFELDLRHTPGQVIIPKDPSLIVPVEGSKGLEIADIEVDSNGNVWIGTTRNGIYRYKESTQHYKDRYLSDLRLRSIHLDPLENLWVVTQKGLDHLELDPSQEFVLDHASYGIEDGIESQINDLSFGFLDQDAIWLATSQGLIRFDPGGAFLNETPPKVSLDRIKLDYEEVDWSTFDQETDPHGLPINLSLPHFADHLTFEFSAYDLSQPNDVAFQCRLEGFEEEWVELLDIRSHTYPQLPPGDYQFQLRSRNGDGYWNEEPLTYDFVIRRPFWMEIWFIALVSIFFILAAYGFTQWRTRRLRIANERLENTVKERTREVQEEKEKSDALLLNILPKETAEELKEKGYAETRDYKGASVLFSDLKGFTSLSEKISADELVKLLDDAFKGFDRLCDQFGVEKIKTIGDAYMCATGIPVEHPQHAMNLVNFAFGMLDCMKELNAKNREHGLPECDIRIGIHSGPLIAGVVGERKFAYDIWGDTVNTASRMESSGEPARINISADTYELVKNHFRCEARGKVKAKNKGELEMYFVLERLP